MKGKDGAPRKSPRSLETRLRPSGSREVRPAQIPRGDISPQQKNPRTPPRERPRSSAQADKYGFLFWLSWILWFAGSCLIAVGFWTFLLKHLFGDIKGAELTLTWVFTVFGSWFVLLTPFMRKKEQIWKRLNVFQEKAVDSVLLAISLLFFSLAASLITWSYVYRDAILASGHTGLWGPWAKAVLASGLIVFLFFLSWMYRQAEIIVKWAEATLLHKPLYNRQRVITRKERLLPQSMRDKIKAWPATLRNGHMVNLKLKDGSQIAHVFVVNHEEILGIYNRPLFDFKTEDICDVESIPQQSLPVYDEAKWVRFD